MRFILYGEAQRGQLIIVEQPAIAHSTQRIEAS